MRAEIERINEQLTKLDEKLIELETDYQGIAAEVRHILYCIRLPRPGEVSHDTLNTLVIGAFRYALGRMTGYVEDVCNMLIREKDSIRCDIKRYICADIEMAFAKNRAGMGWDKACWEEVLKIFRHDTARPPISASWSPA